MAYIGLKHPVFAPIVSEPANGLPTYGTGLVVGRAIAANVSIELSDSKLPADDTIVEIDNSFISGTITTGIDDLSDEALKIWLGQQAATLNGVATIRSAASYEAPNGGFGYYRVRKKNGVRSYRAYWYYKTKWGMPSEDASTKPDGAIEWQTPEVQGTIMATQDSVNSWRDQATFSTEAEAVAWLNELANIGEPADKANLNATIASAQALDPETYTSVSWVDVANALSDAVAVAAMESPSQTRVDDTKSLLETAVAALVPRV
ncbi:phage major tail protein, phi13 family [Desulforamulus reducens MI-1]|uniref:Phage major tail protein, phi13 family n=1 Tax=Desulforamulus reducens (strain ATCC BAA-1160 / DSM 100696 / MI-1) TaxID=349161 RepID=A4J7Q7_DESRM|nr:major tail protein [Desulforamulus reducens]ABO51110.1 phage major tail protein, phi13 family [Desulforamulus reducens MI-1]